MPIIEFDNVSFSYGEGIDALDGVSLSITEGEFVCVLGGNGGGKSTLAKHVNALLMPDSGEVRVLGMPTSDPANTFAIRSKVGMVFQNPDDQLVASIVEDDVAFGPENLGIEPAEIRERVTSALERVGLAGFEKREVATLSGGQKQRVAIAGALATSPRILVLDEAGAMLDPVGQQTLMSVCRKLNADGITIVMITHFMEDSTQADRVIVLDEGRVALDGAPSDVLTRDDELSRLHLDIPFAVRMSRALQRRGIAVEAGIDVASLAAELRTRVVGKRGSVVGDSRAASVDRAANDSPAASVGPAANPLITFQDVSFSYATPRQKKGRAKRGERTQLVDTSVHALHNVSFDLHEGEILGIAGHTGSGKSTLVQLCNGLLQPSNGRVLVRDSDLSDKKAAVEARREIGLVFQYPEHQLFAPTVFEDVAFGPRNLGCTETEVEQRVREALEAVHLDFGELRDRSPFALSGGQQRRVAFAGVLAMRPQALLLDEPVAGLDPQARESFLQLIEELHARRGLSIAIVSHSMDDLARLCDRVMLLNDGELVALDTPARVFADIGKLEDMGLAAPGVVQLAQELGLAYDCIPTVEELAGRIAHLL